MGTVGIFVLALIDEAAKEPFGGDRAECIEHARFCSSPEYAQKVSREIRACETGFPAFARKAENKSDPSEVRCKASPEVCEIWRSAYDSGARMGVDGYYMGDCTTEYDRAIDEGKLRDACGRLFAGEDLCWNEEESEILTAASCTR